MESQLRLGRRYQNLEIIGQGGMGIVYRAYDRFLERLVALKTVKSKSKPQAETTGVSERERLVNEFRVLASLRHPNIVSVLDYGFDEGGEAYFTMELLESHQTLDTLAPKLTLDKKLNILGQVLRALAYLHRRQILHRDLKPSNVLVQNNKAKLLDFGLASEDGSHPDEKSHTVSGTLSYLAPELLRGEVPSIAADLYAFGMLMLQIIGNYYPFQTENLNELIQAILYSQVDLEAVEMPDSLKLIILRLLDKDAENRYQSVEEIILALWNIGVRIPAETYETRESYLTASSFIGREQELMKLKAMLYKLSKGVGDFCLVAGESGIGKSRLLTELRTITLTQGISTYTGQAIYKLTRPYEIWKPILRHIQLDFELSVEDKRILNAAFSNQQEMVENLPVRLALVLKRCFAQLPATVLILDDLQWADDASLSLLKQLKTLCQYSPILIIGAYRSDEVAEIRDYFKNAHILLLPRLATQSVADILQRTLGRKDELFVDAVMRQSEGNPFFLIEILRNLAEQHGQLSKVDAVDFISYQVPSSIRSLVLSRFMRISASHQELLRLFALDAYEIEMSLVEFFVENPENFLHACEEAALITVRNNHWYFAHAHIRDVIVQDVDAKQVQQMHAKIAHGLEAINQEEVDERLAYHWQKAGNLQKEFYYCHQAGNRAFKIYALEKTIEHFQRAIEISKVAKLEEPANYRHLYTQLGTSHELNHDYALAKNNYEQELELAQHLNDELLRLNALTNLCILYARPTANFNESLGSKLLDDALELAHRLKENLELARLYWASMLYHIHANGNTLRASEAGYRSLEYATLANHARQTAYTLHDLAKVHFYEANFDEGYNFITKALRLWQKLENIAMQADVYGTLAHLYTLTGDYIRAIESSHNALAMANEIHHDWQSSLALASIGSIFMTQGYFEQAEKTMLRAIEYADSSGNLTSFIKVQCELSILKSRVEDFSEAQNLVDIALERAETHQQFASIYHTPQIVDAWLALKIGDIAKAKEKIRQLSIPAFNFAAPPSYLGLNAETRVEIALLENEPLIALEIAEEFLETCLNFGLGLHLPLAYHLNSICLYALGRGEEAQHSEAQSISYKDSIQTLDLLFD